MANLKSFSRAIDNFCRRHPGFGIPKMMLIIVGISAVVTLLINVLTPTAAYNFMSLMMFHAGRIMRGEVWRIVTWIFIPLNSSGGISGLFFTAIALYFYYFIGSTLEREWGSGKFTIFYIFGMLMHIVYGFISYYVFKAAIGILPTYLNLSMFFAFAVLFPDHTVRLFFILPIKIKWLALLNAVFFLIAFISNLAMGSFIAAFMPVTALLNFFLICGSDLLANIRPTVRRTAYKASPQVISFKREAKKAKRDMDSKPFRHQCAVCGKTDVDHPELEFRYCSQCEGYHCFCSEHINNHIHFSQ